MLYVIVFLIIFAFVVYMEYCVLQEINLHRTWNPSLYNGLSFPYDERPEDGYKNAAKRKIVLAGLVRDGMPRIRDNIDRLHHLGSHFQDYKIVVFENDSTDGTREYLEEQDIDLLGGTLNEESATLTGTFRSDSRISRMTRYRNEMLEYVLEKYGDYDYLLVIDLDSEGPCAVDGVMHTLSREDEWDMVASNGQMPVAGSLGGVTVTYDPQAFLMPDMGDDRLLVGDLLHQDNYLRTYSDDLVPVTSAFNGAAMYRISAIGDARYETTKGCEHIGFHENLKTDRKFVDRKWIWYVGFQGPRRVSAFI